MVPAGIATDLSAWPEAAGHQGIEAGDAICQTLARQGGLPGAETFVAWLSSTPVDAADRIAVDGPFRRLDGFPFAFSKADLLDGFASTTLHVNELGSYIAGPYDVWTATSGAGALQQGTSCVDWTSSSNVEIASVGSASRARNAHWTAMTGRPCSVTARLYCFQNQITQALPVFADGFELGSTARWSSSTP